MSITNTGAGHHVPTDFPGRHMILVVTAEGGGPASAPVDGPLVPEWGGAQAGLPGRAYAKVLRDNATGAWPVVSYWKPSQIVSDTRLAAMATDTATYTFAAQGGGPVTVTAHLLFRRLLADEAEARGWDVADIVMERASIVVAMTPWYRAWLPVVMSDA